VRVKPLADWTQEDLDLVVRANQKENVSIDYKASEALNFDDKKPLTTKGGMLGNQHRDELIRDVCSMANAEGGRIYFGISEKKGGYPKANDGGYDAAKTNADRIEQILITNVHPRLQGLTVQPVPLKNGKHAFVVEIDKASSHAPHQADDKIYYKRRDATRLPMDDYEVRDAMRRSIEYGHKYGTAWDLYVELRRLDHAMRERVQLDSNAWHKRDSLIIRVSNNLRAGGVAIMTLDKEMRMKVADLIVEIDRFNSVIEVVDPGQGDSARITEPLRRQLLGMINIAQPAYASLMECVKEAP
jgi:predicted HTH transcriptional regulator